MILSDRRQRHRQQTIFPLSIPKKSLEFDNFFTFDTLVYRHIYEQLGKPLQNYIQQAKRDINHMHPLKSKKMFSQIQRRLKQFTKKRNSNVKLLFSTSNSKKTFPTNQNKQSQSKHIYDSKRLDQAAYDYYFKDKSSIKINRQTDSELVKKLILRKNSGKQSQRPYTSAPKSCKLYEENKITKNSYIGYHRNLKLHPNCIL